MATVAEIYDRLSVKQPGIERVANALFRVKANEYRSTLLTLAHRFGETARRRVVLSATIRQQLQEEAMEHARLMANGHNEALGKKLAQWESKGLEPREIEKRAQEFMRDRIRKRAAPALAMGQSVAQVDAQVQFFRENGVEPEFDFIGPGANACELCTELIQSNPWSIETVLEVGFPHMHCRHRWRARNITRRDLIAAGARPGSVSTARTEVAGIIGGDKPFSHRFPSSGAAKAALTEMFTRDDWQPGEELFVAIKDGDGDGWIDDGLPTMRPVPTKAAAEAVAAEVKDALGEEDLVPAAPRWRKAKAGEAKKLKLPPAWTEVEVNEEPRAGVVARGRDAKGRLQSRYSEGHNARQHAIKHARMRALDGPIRNSDKQMAKDAKTSDAALVALLLRRFGMRVGSESNTKAEKKAYGASNLRASHASVEGDVVTLDFIGKKGVPIRIELRDRELAAAIKRRLEERAGDEQLFDTDENEVRAYLRELVPGLTPKDLRTWFATTRALELVRERPWPETEKERKQRIREIAKRVAALLGNTPKVALDSYIDPAVFP